MVDKEKQILSFPSTANVYRLSRVKVSGTCRSAIPEILGFWGVWGFRGVLGCLGFVGVLCFWGVLCFRVFGGFGGVWGFGVFWGLGGFRVFWVF